jgi:hypothetical protein
MEAFGEDLLPIVTSHTHDHLFGISAGDVQLRLSELGDNAVPVGSALLSRDRNPGGA